MSYLNRTKSRQYPAPFFRASGTSPVRHILAPTDLTDRSRVAIQYAVQLARHSGATLTLLYVWSKPDPFGPISGPLNAVVELDSANLFEEKQQAERALYSLQARIRAQHSPTYHCFLIGEPGPLILRAAKDFLSDLIVISRSHYDWLNCVFVDAYFDKIIREAPCPVLVIPDVIRKQAFVGTNSIWPQTTEVATALA